MLLQFWARLTLRKIVFISTFIQRDLHTYSYEIPLTFPMALPFGKQAMAFVLQPLDVSISVARAGV